MRSIRLLAVTGAALSLAAPVPASAASGWRWPVEGPVITRFRNGDDPYARGQHRGIDIAAPVGFPVVAAVAGRVTFAGTAGSSGRVVAVVDRYGVFETSYLHLSSLSVHTGQPVEASERVGAVGVTGRRSVAQPHLHFGVRRVGDRFAYLDPLLFLPPSASGPETRPPVAVPVAATKPVKLEPAPLASTPGLVQPRPAPLPAVPGLPLALQQDAVFAPSRQLGLVHGGRTAPRSRRAGDAGRDTGRAPAREHERALARPLVGRDRASVPIGRDRQAPLRARPTASAAGRRGGLDLGWLAACAGLVLVALLLGRPVGPRTAARRCMLLLGEAARSPHR